jgi:hypothetical protein
MTLKFLIGTLDCLPEVILDIDEISNFLSKLKQDYNQYLHPDYLDELSSWSILRQDSNLVILNIWYQLNEMPTEKWTESSYHTNYIMKCAKLYLSLFNGKTVKNHYKRRAERFKIVS